ncbi:MAG: 6-pyruvoyl-tetrahydropterin synthase-related protein [Dokdonella sp.]|uniref:6-pyruvoyl-tetrahydropterin synthase-related protein n=1 Tax=Dokdonella sp. TaxID=2291710 RepID=UPI003264CEF0
MSAERRLSFLCAPIATLLSAALLIAFTPGLAAYFDWPLHLWWAQEFSRNLSEGTLYPRWMAGANGGYGSPAFVFYGPLAYWVASAATMLSGSALAGLKSVYIAAVLISACSCSALYRSPGSDGWLLAVTATVSPPLLMLVTHYNLPAAALAASISPWVVAGVQRARTCSARDVSAIAVPFALVALAQLPSAFMLGVAALLLATTRLGAPSGLRTLWIVAGSLATGIGLCAFYVLPALWELQWVHADALVGGVLDWRANLLFDPDEPFLQRARGDAPYLEPVAMGVLSIATLAWIRQEFSGTHAKKIETRRWFVCTLVLLALCTPLAASFYTYVPGAAFLQFGWRWLPLASIFAWSAASSISGRTSKANTLAASIALPAFALLASFPLLFGTGGSLPPVKRTSDAQIRWALSASRLNPPEHVPLSVETTPSGTSTSKLWTTIYGDAVATPLLERDDTHVWRTLGRTDSVVRMKILCYPAWRVLINQQETPIGCDRDGVIVVKVPHGSHVIEATFAMTADRWIGWISSVLTLTALGGFAGWRNWRSRPRRSSRFSYRNPRPQAPSDPMT